MRIYITGCAKSGTTLLRRLFYAFEDITVIGEEIHLNSFIKHPNPASIVVGKRTYKTIFSNTYEMIPINKQIRLIEKTKDLRIINIVRDGRDVVLSDNCAVPPLRWADSMHQRRKLNHLIDMEIIYEDLISCPDVIQQEIMFTFGLKKKYKFSEYPCFVPKKANNISKSNYTLRPIDGGNKNKDMNGYRNIIGSPALLKRFHYELELGGYI